MKKQNANKSSDTLTLAGISNAMAKLTLEEANSSSLPTEGNPTFLSMPKGETSSGIFLDESIQYCKVAFGLVSGLLIN